ncbi:transketolase [Rhodococcoides fascians]|uniref:transketolase family protein n=1 Tax=Rhodococcoides fascians TaxID=1828 RepID=UPI000B9B8162|nr:transketolase [Rhodococcus fascians]OZE83505.1 transketolase [Rhodococcus fascians]
MNSADTQEPKSFNHTDMWTAFGTTMSGALETDPRAVVVLADIGAHLFKAAAIADPNRVINVGIREQLMMGVAGGLAMCGMRPVVHTVAAFLVERPLEQIKLNFAQQDVGAVLVSWGASYDLSEFAFSHFTPGDITVIDSMPNWTVHVPGHPQEAADLLLESLPGDGRVYLRLSSQVNRYPHAVRGTSFTPIKYGNRGVVLAVGPCLDAVLSATSMLDVTILYAATIRPFDATGLCAAVQAVNRPNVVLVEPYLAGTSAHQVSSSLVSHPHRLLSLGVRREMEDRHYGTPDDHDHIHGLDARSLSNSINSFLG